MIIGTPGTAGCHTPRAVVPGRRLFLPEGKGQSHDDYAAATRQEPFRIQPNIRISFFERGDPPLVEAPLQHGAQVIGGFRGGDARRPQPGLCSYLR